MKISSDKQELDVMQTITTRQAILIEFKENMIWGE